MDEPEERRVTRAAMFARKRRNRTRQQGARAPLARVESADELRSLWRPENVAGTIRPTDEPIELWRELRARLRARP